LEIEKKASLEDSSSASVGKVNDQSDEDDDEDEDDDDNFPVRQRSHTIGTLHSIQESSVNSLRARIAELENEVKDQRKRFWKTQDRNSQTRIQVKRRVSADFSGVITKQQFEMARLKNRVEELQLSLTTAQEAAQKELERVKEKYQIERAGFVEKVRSLEDDIAEKEKANRALEVELTTEQDKVVELSSSLAQEKSQVLQLEGVLEKLRCTQVRLTSHVKTLNSDQWIVRVVEISSLKRCQFRVSSDWDIKYLKNILRAVYLSSGRDDFDLELYQGDPDSEKPLTSLSSLILSSSMPFGEENKDLLTEVGCKPEDIHLPIADLSLKLIPRPQHETSLHEILTILPEHSLVAEVSLPKTLSILPESSSEKDVQQPQDCCVIS